MQTIYDFDLKGLEEMLGTLGQKPYRAKQLFNWLYRKRAKTFDEMSDLPAALIQELKQRFVIMPLKEIDRQVAHDGTMKFLFEMQDGSSVESVLMHFAYGESLCVSSQVGCNMACTFCASGLLKKQRSLTAGEMAGEAMFVQELLDEDQRRLDNIVIMGTGEPFDNYDNVMRFCAIINSDHGLAIGARHITISTCGIVPRINDFADAHLQYNLAVSLHASNDALRRKLMPIDKAYPMDQLIAALKRYSENNHRRLTFEYILLRNVNDRDENAIELANLIRGMNAYVNLIPYNEVDENGYRTTDAKTALHFYDVLMKHGVKATLRTKHGDDIDAACGQLRAKHEREKEAQ
ncbi:MAG: 23S rRNA (adenine(2503)-C(2))-methyltransferase RlmN [Lactimicrobium sp.]|jgi:23S rRNA (adenine2503-C2)-methyltransferase|uniref:23S rRNA (adenine(2503)-C(2))-methyltransferase RlmN n=1 Tax=Lactimicrobium sp. TaxID=2563780 RepID=UPI002F3598B9